MMKLVFWGTPQFAVPSLQRLLNEPDFEVLGVVTQPDKRRGRGSQLVPSPVKQKALEYNLPVWQPNRVKKDAQTLNTLRSLQADAFVVVAYGQILSPEILAMPRLGCVNGHGSLLPAYRGAAPIQWSIWNGDATTGITTMLMDAGMDTGPMLLKASIAIDLLDDAVVVGERLAEVSAGLLVDTLLQLNQGTLQPTSQEDAIATYARLLQKSDFGIDWTHSAIAIHNQVRALVPNVMAQFRGQPMKILQTVPLGAEWQTALPAEFQALTASLTLDPAMSSPPGTVVHVVKSQGPVIQTGEGLLLLRTVQPAGKRPQSGWDFANGVRLQPGDRFENGSVPISEAAT
ncbi:MAG TPA: methionyl-tRNA formyltransferase [Stenomitos sp.]